MATARRPALSARLAGFGTTIFHEMSTLAARTGAINLGQGFPDTDGPPEVVEAAVAALRAGHNQYPPGDGIPSLRAAVAAHQRRFYGLEFDPDGEVLITVGATEAIASALLGLCEAGDEVIALEPYYDSYAACVAMADATLRPVTLRPPDFRLDPAELAAAVTPRTRLILLNTPHNPTGAVLLARRARGGRRALPRARPAGRHRRGLRAPRLRRRARAAGDAAGDGGAHADDLLGRQDVQLHRLEGRLGVRAARARRRGAHGQAVPHLHGGDAAAARGRRGARAARRLLPLARRLAARQARPPVRGARGGGPRGFRPAGTYFVNTDVRSIGEEDGVAFCWSLPERAGVAAIPTAVFYADPERGRSLVRFAFCKRDEVIDEAARRLADLRS